MNYIENPQEQEDFDSVAYINQKFCTESSLENLDEFIIGIGNQISLLDEEISKTVQHQSVVGKQASKDIKDAKQSMGELFDKIHNIKLKASQSESMVQEICADIKKLDYAKNHLQTSITSLNRLQMLINAVGQLELLANEHQYREVANLFDAVKQFMSHFEEYKHISMIVDISNRVQNILNNLTSHVQGIFREVAQLIEVTADTDVILGSLPNGVRSLQDACLVVDALGPKVRQGMLEEFVQLQLVAYENLFAPGKAHFSLDQVERRWAWFKRLQKYIDSKFGTVFPTHWRLPLRLCLEFTERTKIHLVLLLTEMESNDDGDISALLKALQSALKFEQEMGDEFHLLQEMKQQKEAEEATKKAKALEVATQRKLKSDDKLMYIPTDHDYINEEDENESGFLALAHASVSGGISGVFDKFLGLYVLLERQNLEDMLYRLGEEEDQICESDGKKSSSASTSGNVYASATAMFVFIKNSIKRCIALTTGQTFLDLSVEFKACMQQYIHMLRTKCEASKVAAAQSMNSDALVTLCYLINTGEYCAEVVPQVEGMVKQRIAPNLVGKVSFEAETEAFMDLVAHCINTLVTGFMGRVEAPFRVMHNMNWSTDVQVGEESSYLHSINNELMEAAPRIQRYLATSYFSTICNKLATEILQKYQDTIIKQKKISEEATQQLLLDTYNIKSLLLHLPQASKPGASTASAGVASSKALPASFLKLVNTKIAHIEMILKLIGTPEELLLERFKLMWPEGTGADLLMLMTLKGTKRPDQQVLLDMLGLSAASKLINKTAQNISNSVSAAGGPGGGTSSGAMGGAGAGLSQATSAAQSAASAAAMASTSMMKSLTQDFSKTGSALASMNMKWTSSTTTSK
jgi:hypothetical protein